MKKKILLGEISSYKAISIARYLCVNYPDLELFTFDDSKFTNFIRTKYSKQHVVLKNCYSAGLPYIKELSKTIKDLNIDFFIPVHSSSMELILKNKHLFGNTLNYIGTYDDYLKLHEKRDLMLIAKSLNIRIPINYQNYFDAKIPFVAKPNNLSSSKGVYYLNSKENLAKIEDKIINNYIYQEYIKGVGCGYSVYCEKGEILVEYGHKRIAEYPISGGSSVYRTAYLHENMREFSQKILNVVKWTGFAMFEFKVTPKNELVLIEVNPRIWGSINQALYNNINLFGPLFGSPHKPKERSSFNTYLTPQVYLSFIKYILKGNLLPIMFFVKNLKKNRSDVGFRDFKGWLSIIIRNLR